MNPCSCGYLGDATVYSKCSPAQIGAYQKRISGPLLDRLDLRVHVSKIKHEHFFSAKSLQQKQHLKVLTFISDAREMQKKRYKCSDRYNAYASINEAKRLFLVAPEAKKLLDSAATKLALTSRGYIRALRVARTIADLEKSVALEATHIAEALQYR